MSTLLPELPEPRLYAHELLSNCGGVWLGCADLTAVQGAHTPGETGDEILHLFTADQVRAIQIETWKAAIEAAAKVCDARSRCWGSDNYKLAAEDETCAMAIRSLPSPE